MHIVHCWKIPKQLFYYFDKDPPALAGTKSYIFSQIILGSSPNLNGGSDKEIAIGRWQQQDMLEMVSRKHFTVKYLLLHRDTLTLNSSSEDQLYNTDRGRAVQYVGRACCWRGGLGTLESFLIAITSQITGWRGDRSHVVPISTFEFMWPMIYNVNLRCWWWRWSKYSYLGH